MNLEKFLKETSKIRNFKVDESCLENVIRIIVERQPTDLWEVFKESDEYFEAIVAIIQKLHDEKLIKVFKNGKFVLTNNGNEFVKSIVPAKVPSSYKINYTFTIPKPLQKILKTMKVIYREVKPKDEYEQGSLRPEAAMRKVAYAIHRGDIAGKHVACVGDDDLLSLIFGMTGLPKSILVLDIDKDILSIIEEYKKKLKISVPIATKLHDLCKPIPSSLRSRYDTFLTQPPDTVLGFTLFVSKGVELLKKNPGMIGYAGLTPTGCPRLGLLEIENVFVKMGLVITDYLNKFCEYPPLRTEIKKVEVPNYIPYPPNKMWYISDLVRMKTTEKTKPFYKNIIKEDIADYMKDVKRFGR